MCAHIRKSKRVGKCICVNFHEIWNGAGKRTCKTQGFCQEKYFFLFKLIKGVNGRGECTVHFMHTELVWPQFGFIVRYLESNAVTCHCDSEGMFTFVPCSERQGGISGGFAHAQGRVHPCSDNIWNCCGRLVGTGEELRAAEGYVLSHQSPTPPEKSC